jgi:hypothetical protein
LYYYCSNFSYAVDSVDSIDLSGHNLKVLHTSSCWETLGDEDWYFSHPNNPTPIIENIGSVLFWFGKWLATNGTNEITGLRCYEDENMLYRSPDWPEPYPCDSIPQVYYTSLHSTSFKGILDIHPNPANSILTISIGALIRGTEIELYTVNGQLVQKQAIVNSENQYNFDVSKLPGGMYLVLILNKGIVIEKQKIIIGNKR